MNATPTRRVASLFPRSLSVGKICIVCLALAVLHGFAEEETPDVSTSDTSPALEEVRPPKLLPPNEPQQATQPWPPRPGGSSKNGQEGKPAGRPPPLRGVMRADGAELLPARERFRKNLQRWRELTPEQQEHFRAREREHLAKVQAEIDQLIRESGVTVDENLRKALWKRYTRDRRELERQLREEMEAQRATRLPALRAKILEDLKTGRIEPMAPNELKHLEGRRQSPSHEAQDAYGD
ncbi:MAG: hypothetical protein SNJ52_05685 [Verrucomicrobiia bacterium]